MRLRLNSRRYLELLQLVGEELLEAALDPGGFARIGRGFSSERALGRCRERLWESGCLEKREDATRSRWVVEVTGYGRSKLQGGVDPVSLWDEKWDGRWRLVAFDLPSVAFLERKRLDAWLATHRFGRLQGSVRVTPRSSETWLRAFEELKIDANQALVWEGDVLGGLDAATIVEKAWDFESINKRYKEHGDYLRSSVDLGRLSRGFEPWREEESRLWSEAVERDPFLPTGLEPPGYLGRQAWQWRMGAYRDRFLSFAAAVS